MKNEFRLLVGFVGVTALLLGAMLRMAIDTTFEAAKSIAEIESRQRASDYRLFQTMAAAQGASSTSYNLLKFVASNAEYEATQHTRDFEIFLDIQSTVRRLERNASP